MTGKPKEEQVTKDEARDLRRMNTELHNENVDLRRRLEALEKGQHAGDTQGVDRGRGGATPRTSARVVADGTAARDARRAAAPPAGHPDFSQESETFYQAIKTRLIDEAPALLRLLVDRPELEVMVERRVIEAEGASTTGRVARLIKADWLEESRRFREILKELERTGTRVNNKSLSVSLQELVVAGFLTKEGVDRYRAVPDMKVRVVEAA